MLAFRLKLLLVIAGGFMVFFGVQEVRVGSTASVNPVDIDLAKLENGEKPANNHVRIGSHLALFDQCVFAYTTNKNTVEQANLNTSITHCYIPIVSVTSAKPAGSLSLNAPLPSIDFTEVPRQNRTTIAPTSSQSIVQSNGRSLLSAAHPTVLAQFTPPGSRPPTPPSPVTPSRPFPPIGQPSTTNPPQISPNLSPTPGPSLLPPNRGRPSINPSPVLPPNSLFPNVPSLAPPVADVGRCVVVVKSFFPNVPSLAPPVADVGRCVVVVKSSKYATVGALPKGNAVASSVQGLFITSIASLAADERKLLSEGLPQVDFNKVQILEEGRRPSSLGFMLALIVGGLVLGLGGLAWMFVK